MLTERHKALGCLNNVFSITAKDVFSFCFYVLHTKNMCYVSLEFSASKLKQDFAIITHKGAVFFLREDAGG